MISVLIIYKPKTRQHISEVKGTHKIVQKIVFYESGLLKKTVYRMQIKLFHAISKRVQYTEKYKNNETPLNHVFN